MTNTFAEQFFDIALWLAGIGHFVLLIGSLQVPFRLNWKQDLAQLHPFNRKLLWVYGGFTLLTIVSFGVLTLTLHRELMRGDRAAMALALFIGAYWACRILVDAFYYSHKDWPLGKRFVLAHVMITSLFVALAGSYLGLVLWHVWAKSLG